MNLKEVLGEQAKLVLISSEEISKLESMARGFISLLKASGLKAYIGGSLAKGTVVRKTGKQDVDIFVVFDKNEDTKNLEKILKRIKVFEKAKLVHGSRDYFQIEGEKVIFEVVPVVKNKNPKDSKNVTDFSLSHVNYVRSETKKNPSLVKEIALAKSFCMANGFYGAESYIKGFSGYSLEVLVIYFGNFVKFLKGISKKQVIDPAKHFRNGLEIKREINTSKISGPVILVDPTYKYRNVSAGLSNETFEKFLIVSKEFLENPSLSFFEKKDVDVNYLKDFAKSNDAVLLELEFSTEKQGGDIAGTKMKKFFDFICAEFSRLGQEVLKCEFRYSGEGSNSVGYFVVKENKIREVRGPPVELKEAVLAFKKAKGRSIFERDGYYWFKEKVSVEMVLERVKKVEKEMNVSFYSAG